MMRPRLRELGLTVGSFPTGPLNAITDVSPVRVGQTTLIAGQGALRPGHGPVRTGVTVVLPHGGNLYREKVPAAVWTINGFGKPCGFEQVRELGVLESPIALTNTLNTFLVADALVTYTLLRNPEVGISAPTVNVVVGETNDGYLNDIQGRHVRQEHVFAALDSASAGPVAEGAVGGGTGTACFGWKGGIGTSSRVAPPETGGFTVGALVQSNFGRPQDLVFCGYPLGRDLLPPDQGELPKGERGSIMMVLATDAPLDGRQLLRLCVRAGAGLARTGSTFGHGSGDFVVAFSTAYRVAAQPSVPVEDRLVLADEELVMSALFGAVAECVEEAILNSLCRAETVVGRDGNVRYALPIEAVQRISDSRARGSG